MSAEYSVEEVRAAINGFVGYSHTHHGIGGDLIGIAQAYANRIKADESAVPVAWQQKRRPEDYPDEWRECSKETFDFVNQRKDSPWIVRELFDNPPAQAAQVADAFAVLEKLGWEWVNGRWCADIADPSTHPHSPDAADSGRIRDALIAAQKLLRQNHDAIRGALDNHERKEATLVMDQIRAALAAQGQGDRYSPVGLIPDDAPDSYAEAYIRDWCPDHVKAYIARKTAPPASSAGVPEGIPLTDTLRRILGKMCFTLIHLANALRAAGYQIDHRAEDEQAVCLHWMLNLYLRHGDDWGKVATQFLEEARAKCAAAPSAPEGDGGAE